jgi:hypothetical protein
MYRGASENQHVKEQTSDINTVLLRVITFSTQGVVLKVHTVSQLLIPHNRKLQERISEKWMGGQTMVNTKNKRYKKILVVYQLPPSYIVITMVRCN